MKITMYELLRLVKNDKAPKKIKYEYSIYELTSERNDYYCKNEMRWFTNEINSLGVLNEEVEIIEEPKEIEKILWREKESLAGNFTASEKQEILARRTEKLKSSLNELIDEINNLKENKCE